MDKWEKYLLYAIPLIGVVALVYYFMTRQQVAAPAAGQAVGAPVAGVGVPSYSGTPTTDPTGQLLALAQQQCGLSGESVIVRGLRPQDLGLNDFQFTSTLVNTWENWVNHTVADCTFIAITGIAYGGTSFSQLRTQAGSSYRGYAPLSFISGLVSQLYFFPQPMIIEQNQPCIMDVISRAAATEGISLMGIVVEKRGMVVNP